MVIRTEKGMASLTSPPPQKEEKLSTPQGHDPKVLLFSLWWMIAEVWHGDRIRLGGRLRGGTSSRLFGGRMSEVQVDEVV
jgi:hypothetical protein